MKDNKYNGWTNYATWRVQLEIVSDYVNATVYDNDNSGISDDWLSMGLSDLAGYFRDYVDEVVGFEQQDGFAYNYAMAFLDEVDWYEIAQHAQDEVKESKKVTA